jgi:hypothetical protein
MYLIFIENILCMVLKEKQMTLYTFCFVDASRSTAGAQNLGDEDHYYE